MGDLIFAKRAPLLIHGLNHRPSTGQPAWSRVGNVARDRCNVAVAVANGRPSPTRARDIIEMQGIGKARTAAMFGHADSPPVLLLSAGCCRLCVCVCVWDETRPVRT